MNGLKGILGSGTLNRVQGFLVGSVAVFIKDAKTLSKGSPPAFSSLSLPGEYENAAGI